MAYWIEASRKKQWTHRFFERSQDKLFSHPASWAEYCKLINDPDMREKLDAPDNPMRIVLRDGVRIPEELAWRIPKSLFHKAEQPYKQIAPFSEQAPETFVNNAVFEIIERFDPGVHQWFPVKLIFQKSMTNYTNGGPFRIFNILHKPPPWELVDYAAIGGNKPITTERTIRGNFTREYLEIRHTRGGLVNIEIYNKDGTEQNSQMKFTTSIADRTDLKSLELLVIKRSSFQGRNIMRAGSQRNDAENRYYSLRDGIIVSDRLGETLLGANIHSIDLVPIRET